MSNTRVRVFVNAAPVDVDRGATALECIRAWRDSEAEDVTLGKRAITDSRGLAIAPASAAQAGSIYRTVSSRGQERDE
jgi:hypothetical protein